MEVSKRYQQDGTCQYYARFTREETLWFAGIAEGYPLLTTSYKIVSNII